MVTISDNDLRTLLRYVQTTNVATTGDLTALNLQRRAKLTLLKLLKRTEVQRIMRKG